MNNNSHDINQNLNHIDIIPSKLDDVLGKACPSAQEGTESISSIWNFLHQTFNARLAQDLKKTFAKFNVQHEVIEGNSRLDIRLVADYQNKVMAGEKPLAVIDLKTGNVKLYQLCLYSVRNKCPVIIVELLSGDVHLVTTEVAGKILANMPSELEKIKELKSLSVTLPGQDCRFCRKECRDRIAEYSPYKISSTTFSERALKLEANYSNVKEKVQEVVESLIEEAKIVAHTDEKEAHSMRIPIVSDAARQAA
ncbi:MAG TPA: hypothetical protein VIO11_02100 [Candidatus Methanoperedens sp.]